MGFRVLMIIRSCLHCWVVVYLIEGEKKSITSNVLQYSYLNGVVPGAGVVCDMEQAVPLPVPEEGDVIGGQAVGVGGGISSWDELSDWLAD